MSYVYATIFNARLMQVPALSEGVADTATVSSQPLQMWFDMQSRQPENEALREYKANMTKKASLKKIMIVFGTKK